MSFLDDFKWEQYKCGGFEIPGHMIGGLQRYVMQGVPPGDFLQAVIRNDFMGAVSRADDANLKNLPAYGAFFYNIPPSNCHGSEHKLIAWVHAGGWEKLREGGKVWDTFLDHLNALRGSKYEVTDDLGLKHRWTVAQILGEINRDRSDEWDAYDETDWREGAEEWLGNWEVSIDPVAD